MGVEVVFKSYLKEVQKKINRIAKERMLEAVDEVRNKTLLKLTGNRSGRTYYVPGTKKAYTASSPGEPPAIATGALRQSIKGKVEGEGRAIVGMVGTDQKYGPMLEFGTHKGKHQILPRPWLRKSFEESQAKVKEIFTRIWFS